MKMPPCWFASRTGLYIDDGSAKFQGGIDNSPCFPRFYRGSAKMREDPATQPLPVGGRAAEEVGTVDGPTRTLRRHPSAIDIVGRARHITCALGAEPDDHFGDLFGVAHALKRGVR